ncbi:MAG: hypothetical protein R2729_20105 [Bryobacteraceae bacterium]
MRQDLDAVKTEIEQALTELGLVVFRGASRHDDAMPMAVFWDAKAYPSPRAFLETAATLDVKPVVFHHRVCTAEMIEEAMERVEAAPLPLEERREFERDLRRLKGYAGFTAAIELSFDYDGNTYFYELTASWYDEIERIVDETELAGNPYDGDDDESGPLGYFSHN